MTTVENKTNVRQGKTGFGLRYILLAAIGLSAVAAFLLLAAA